MDDPRRSHSITITVRPEDIDELGHVNNAVYLRWVEEVARAHSDSLGMTVDVFRANGVVPVVRRHVITYHRPAVQDERLVLSTRIVKAGGVRAVRRNEVRRENGELVAEAETEWVWVDPESGRPRNPPQHIFDAYGGPVG
ncbi:MAG TPA: acyl-CoA thioesterase [Deinococcales bacterium]|nr:acyl-CoA thioesterase [Deinococcales bacterium]